MIRTIFMGTPEFAVPILETIAPSSLSIQIVAVVSQPDQPVGRKQILTPSPVKQAALRLGLPLLQPDKLRSPESVEIIKNLKPDLIIVAAYGQIIPKDILETAPFGALNIHPSLLPKFRGASPIQSTILSGEKETGATIMLMDELLDHGPILAQATIPVEPDDTGASLSKKLSLLGAKMLVEMLPDWIEGKIKPQEQNHAAASTTKLLTREDGRLDWTLPAKALERKIRAYDPWPGAWTTGTQNKKTFRFQIIKARVRDSKNKKKPGTVLPALSGFAAQCGQDLLEVIELQPEGKRIMNSAEFLRGHPDFIGTILS